MDCSLENAFTNTDIWENIFKYFNLREQIHLTHVCGLFRHIITSSTWKIKCKQLKLYPIDTNAALVTNQIDNIERYNAYSDPMYKLGYNDCKIADVANKSSILLNCDEVRELLDMNFSNVNKLQILEKTSEAENESTLFSFLIQNQFTELKTLNLFGIHRLSVENLNSIKINCPQLNTLILSHCRCNGEQGVLQDHNGISKIASMKMLKTLIVREKHIKYELNHIIDVIIKLQHVAQLVFKINIVGNNSDIISEMSAINLHENLCELISVNFDVANKISLPVITKLVLRNFENLGVLSMSSSNSPLFINRSLLEDLTKSCKHLKKLYLEFCNFEDFVPMSSLENLTLVNCNNISWINLKSILSQQNLKSFTSFFTRFSDNFVHFYIESPLEYLRIETMEYDFREDFKKLLLYNSKQMKKLNTLIWHDFTLWYEDEPIAMHLTLQDTYHNLQSLFIDLSVIAFDDILEMKALKQLTFVENENSIDLSNLFTIFKHPTLKKFSFYTRNLECSLKVPINELLRYQTNLRLVQIPLDMFNKVRNVWFSMLSTNPKLQLACYFNECNAINYTYLKDLIENDKFPARIKSIKICDLTIDCNSFKENPNSVMDMIMAARQYCNQLNEVMYLKL